MPPAPLKLESRMSGATFLHHIYPNSSASDQLILSPSDQPRRMQGDISRLAERFKRSNTLPLPLGCLGSIWSVIPNTLVNPSTSWANAGVGPDISYEAHPISPPELDYPEAPPGLIKTPVPTFNPWRRRGSTSTASSCSTSTRVLTPAIDAIDEMYAIPTPLFKVHNIPYSACETCGDEQCSSLMCKGELLHIPFLRSPKTAKPGAGFTFEDSKPTKQYITTAIPLLDATVQSIPSTFERSPSSITSDNHESDFMGKDAIVNRDTRAMVNEGIDIILWSGTEALVRILLEQGIQEYASAIPIATVAHTILKELSIRGIHKFKELRIALRFGALSLFRDHWKLNGEWQQSTPPPATHSFLTLRGVNIAGFIGSLYSAGITTADDVHLCLNFLVNHAPDFNRLCAIHALIVHANDKLCKSKYIGGTTAFLDKISMKNLDTGAYWWGDGPSNEYLVNDILNTVDRWFAAQTVKRARSGAGPTPPVRSPPRPLLLNTAPSVTASCLAELKLSMANPEPTATSQPSPQMQDQDLLKRAYTTVAKPPRFTARKY